MRSTFMGLEASKKGLFVQQSALYTTGHNISNANTEGYSRQRVNMQATQGYPQPGLNSPTYPGHLGTGVEASSVQRIRDEFIDRQYRQETNKLGYWESTLQSINQMEDILSEPSEFGINQSFNDFWKALEDVSTNPEDNAARKVALAKAEALADSFNYNYKQLETIQRNIGNEISVSTTKINSLLKQIAEINAQVQAVEPNGYVTNDLYDARDVLVDQLNELIPVSIERVPSGGNASEVAEGSLTIKFNGITLVEGKGYATVTALGGEPVRDAGVVTGVDLKQIDGNNLESAFAGLSITYQGFGDQDPDQEDIQLKLPVYVSYNQFETSKGKLLALIDAYGHKSVDAGDVTFTESATADANGFSYEYKLDNIDPTTFAATAAKGIYPEMLQNLDKLANSFKEAFNAVHQQGYSLDGTPVTKEITDDLDNPIPNLKFAQFFMGDGASGLKVNGEFLKNPSAIAASTGKGEEGNGKWAIELANLQFLGMKGDETTTTPQSVTLAGKTFGLPDKIGLDGATFQDFYVGFIGDLAVAGQEATRLEYNSGTLRLTIENNRASMSSVSLDEEMSNMITFQQAYNANARMITVVDETLDKIINGMGRVGL